LVRREIDRGRHHDGDSFLILDGWSADHSNCLEGLIAGKEVIVMGLQRHSSMNSGPWICSFSP
jgi:hypothetical protein